MKIDRHAEAEWLGSIKEGSGSLTTDSGVLKQANYGFKSRFESGPGTNPEELLAAAHAGCFSMALSGAHRRRHSCRSGFIPKRRSQLKSRKAASPSQNQLWN